MEDLEKKIKKENKKLDVKELFEKILSSGKAIIANEKKQINKQSNKTHEQIVQENFQKNCEKDYQDFLRLYDDELVGTIEHHVDNTTYLDAIISTDIVHTEHGPIMEITKSLLKPDKNWIIERGINYEKKQYKGYILDKTSNRYIYIDATIRKPNPCQYDYEIIKKQRSMNYYPLIPIVEVIIRNGKNDFVKLTGVYMSTLMHSEASSRNKPTNYILNINETFSIAKKEIADKEITDLKTFLNC